MKRVFLTGPLVLVLLGGFHNAPQAAVAQSAENEPSADSPAPPASEIEKVRAGRIRLTPPESWLRKKPRSSFVAAELALPRVEGDERDGRLTVSMAGGSIEANVARWKSQFGGKPARESEKKFDIAGVTATVVDFSGTYNDARGPFAPGVQRKGYRMLGAIIPAGGRLHFVKAYGPEKTMEKHHQAFQAFLKTLEVDEG
jgi:hypothetical protein